MNTSTIKLFFVAMLLIGSLNACSTSPTPRLYILEPMAASANSNADPGIRITVGPVTLPEHLDRKGIVTHDQRYQVSSAEFDRWAEPLDHNITRVLSENLAALLPSNQVVAYPRSSPHGVDFAIPVRITSFGSNPNGTIMLNATWSLEDASGTPGETSRTTYSAPRRGDDVLSQVAAMSAAVEQLSRDIANAIVAAAAEPTE